MHGPLDIKWKDKVGLVKQMQLPNSAICYRKLNLNSRYLNCEDEMQLTQYKIVSY